MNVTPETVAAVNAWLEESQNLPLHVDTDDVRALILALAKCEPVSTVVEAANDLHEMLTAVGGPRAKASERVQRLAAALATFAEVE